jgi:hypothetical protein
MRGWLPVQTFFRISLIRFYAIVYRMSQPISVCSGSLPDGNVAENLKKTTIQIASPTKDYLDKIKEQAGVETYDPAILYLIHEWKKHLPSSFGSLPGIGHFVREEDSHRIRH